jgi:SNF family Na+-dependent transporter
MSHVIGILVVVIILLTQNFLSSRKNPYLGGILPVVYIGFISFFFNKLMANSDHFSTWLMIMAALCGLLSIWISGRERFKKKRQKESDRIELQNL